MTAPQSAPASGPEPKDSAASALQGQRPPVTRWNRRYLLAGGAAVASLIALAFYLGFGGAERPKPKDAKPAEATNVTPGSTAMADRYPQGYADPAVVAASGPGTASLPPAGADPAATSTTPPPQAQAAPVDPAVEQARTQAMAARSSSPFFQALRVAAAAAPASPPPYAGLPSPGATPALAVPGAPLPEAQPGNGQAAKSTFAETARAEDYVTAPLRAPRGPWEVKAGTLIPAALLTAINSDLPGDIIAQVTAPVYDHVTGRTVLIPQGSRLIGKYDSQIVYGQERVLIAWNRIVMPDGRSINMGSMSGADLSGASGLKDQVDDHFGQLARGILLSTVFSVGAASAQDASNRSSGGLVVNSAANGIANNANQVGNQISSRDLNRQPTLKVRAGWPLRVIVNKDMVLAPYGGG